jgi:hypothetical protein
MLYDGHDSDGESDLYDTKQLSQSSTSCSIGSVPETLFDFVKL